MRSGLPLADDLVSIVHDEYTSWDLLLQVRAVYTLQAHIGHSTRHDIKACSNRDNVEFMLLAIARYNAFLGKLFDFVTVLLGDVDYFHVVTVKHFIVILLKARTLDAERMWWFQRAQEVSLLWVAYPCSLLLGPEVVNLSIRFLVKEVIFVST